MFMSILVLHTLDANATPLLGCDNKKSLDIDKCPRWWEESKIIPRSESFKLL